MRFRRVVGSSCRSPVAERGDTAPGGVAIATTALLRTAYLRRSAATTAVCVGRMGRRRAAFGCTGAEINPGVCVVMVYWFLVVGR